MAAVTIGEAALAKIVELILQRLQSDKDKFLVEIQACISQAAKEKEAELEGLKNDLQDARWFLGEERARRESLELQLREKNEYVHKMEEYSQKLKSQHDEAAWQLGEEKSKREHSENSLSEFRQRCESMEGELNSLREKAVSAEQQLRDTQWYLGEERARREALEQQLKEIQGK